MEFTTGPAVDRPPNIVERYVEYIGSTEPDHTGYIRQTQRRSPYGMAMRLGRGCVIAQQQGQDEDATKIFEQVRSRLERRLTNDAWAARHIGRQATQLKAMATMLEYRHDTPATLQARNDLHLSVVDTAWHLRSCITADIERSSNGGLNSLNGMLLETVTIALATRLSDHPGLLGVPALMHHDRGVKETDAPNNYDMLIVRSAAEEPGYQAHRIQIKTGCLGLCDAPRLPRRQIQRREYAPGIVLLASCCDLDIRGPEQNETLLHWTQVLADDVRGEAPPADLNDLDALTSSVLVAVTSNDPGRRGTFGLEPDAAPAPDKT